MRSFGGSAVAFIREREEGVKPNSTSKRRYRSRAAAANGSRRMVSYSSQSISNAGKSPDVSNPAAASSGASSFHRCLPNSPSQKGGSGAVAAGSCGSRVLILQGCAPSRIFRAVGLGFLPLIAEKSGLLVVIRTFNFARARALFRLRSEKKRISENYRPPGGVRAPKFELGATSSDVHAFVWLNATVRAPIMRKPSRTSNNPRRHRQSSVSLAWITRSVSRITSLAFILTEIAGVAALGQHRTAEV
jgi:hypothetical protein